MGTENEPLIASAVNGESDQDSQMENNFRPLLSEFIGVTVFVFVGTLVVQTGDIVAIGLAHGFMIALLIMGLGKIR